MIASEEQWIALLIETLGELAIAGKAVTGAGLNSQLLKKAGELGLEPPLALKRRKFKSLLARLAEEGKLLLLVEAGADVLVAPASNPGLLTNDDLKSRRSFPGIRRDLFTAFTWVNEKKPFYSVEKDEVRWFTDEREGNGLVTIPPPDFEKLKRRALQFAEGLQGSAREVALHALDHVKPLSAFSNFVSSHGLSKQWHEFRTSSIVSDISDWAKSNGLVFRSDWLTSASDGAAAKVVPSSAESNSADRPVTNALSHFLSSLSPDEVARITVPLDVVLRLIRER